MSRRDKNYLLHWVLVQFQRKMAEERRDAANHRSTASLERMGIFADTTVWPIEFTTHPLEAGPGVQAIDLTHVPVAKHFRDVAAWKARHGMKSATLLTIRTNEGQGAPKQFFIIHLAETGHSRGQSARYMSMLDTSGDGVDEILECVRTTAEKKKRSIWKKKLIEKCIDKVMR